MIWGARVLIESTGCYKAGKNVLFHLWQRFPFYGPRP